MTDENDPKAVPAALLARVANGFAASGEALDVLKVQCNQAARQQGIMNRRAAIMDGIAARWSKLLQELRSVAPGDQDALAHIAKRAVDLEAEMAAGPTSQEDDDLRALQAEIQKRPRT